MLKKKLKTKNNKLKNTLKSKVKKPVTKIKKVIKKILPKKKIIRKTKPSTIPRKTGVTLERSIQNPIISPRLYTWESRATFNPTAIELSGKVHLIYRAIGDNDVSVLGYASSYDGYKIDERLPHLIYHRFNETNFSNYPIGYSSGGGWGGGTEDPRATILEDRLYVLYNAFDSWSSCRVAMVSMSIDDFKNRRWHKWTNPIFLSPPGQISKAWVLFPERINGKIAILHDIWPSVTVTYFDDFEDIETGKVKIKQQWDRWFHHMNPSHWVYIHPGTDGGRFVDPAALSKNIWLDVEKDIWVRNTGPSPIKTREGWLILHHAMEARDPGKFKLFALLLDLKDPTRVLYRSTGPVLEPKENYESHIIYSCGAVVKSGRLFVYYGAGDQHVGVASVRLATLIEDMKKHRISKLKSVDEKVKPKKGKK